MRRMLIFTAALLGTGLIPVQAGVVPTAPVQDQHQMMAHRAHDLRGS